MDISIIIPNFNGEQLLRKNLPKVFEAVKSYKKGKIEIIVSDDPSTDNSKEVISKFFAHLNDSQVTGKFIENRSKKEAGFSKNVNRGIAAATGDILILLNTDVVPRVNFLNPLLKHFDDKKVFAVGCMDESIEESGSVLRGRGVGSWQRGFLMHKKGEIDKNNTLWVSGGSGAFRKSIWDKLHGLDPLYNPFYWEDIDLSYRALKSGYSIYFESKSVVIHEHEKGVIKSKFKSSEIKKIAYRNQFIFVWKNITESKLIRSHIYWLPYHFIKALLNNDKEFFGGFILALAAFPQIMRSRTFAKKYFVKSDSEILKEFSE